MDISAIKRMVRKTESGQALDPAGVTTAIIRVAAILVIGVVILNGVIGAAGLEATDPFYNLSQSVVTNIESGYTLAALMVLALGAAAIMRFMGFL